MQSVAVLSHADCGLHDTGWSHPEHVGRIRAIARALRNDVELFQNAVHLEGRHATAEELALAHDPNYIASVQALATQLGESPDYTQPHANLDADTVISAASWSAATAAAGCVLDAVDLAMTNKNARSFCIVRPPGHHALRDRAMGFCLFGNVAIAAHYARRHHHAQRVLIVDWDVHHGNGTQALVQDDPNIHFLSLHQWPWYPGTGAAADRGPHENVWNVPLPSGVSAENYIAVFERSFKNAVANFTPDLIFISAGFDSLAGDPLSEFPLELPHIDYLTRFVTTNATALCSGRVVSVLEGGYAPERVAQAVVTHLRALADLAYAQ